MEPKIHSFIEDSLPENHPLAREDVHCKTCDRMVHAFNNECMTIWVETGQGNFCMQHFIEIMQPQEGQVILFDGLAITEYKPEIWIIEKLWIDTFENSSSAAKGYRPEGYCTSEEEADRLIKSAGDNNDKGWPLMGRSFPVLRKIKLSRI